MQESTHFLKRHSTCCLEEGGGTREGGVCVERGWGGAASSADSSFRALADIICLVQLNATMCALGA